MKKNKTRQKEKTTIYKGCNFERPSSVIVSLDLENGGISVRAPTLKAAQRAVEQIAQKMSRRRWYNLDYR